MTAPTMRCVICAEDMEEFHEKTNRHHKNTGLVELAKARDQCAQNKRGIVLSGTVGPTAVNSDPLLINSEKSRLSVSVKPREGVKFSFRITNHKRYSVVFGGVAMLSDSKLNFELLDNELRFGTAEYSIKPNTSFNKEVSFTFQDAVVGFYKMSVYFSFPNEIGSTVVLKELVVIVESERKVREVVFNPFTHEAVHAERIVPAKATRRRHHEHPIPTADHRAVFEHDLKTTGLTDDQKQLAEEIKTIIDEGPGNDNYEKFFKHLLWFDETFVGQNLKNYNMSGVPLEPRGKKGRSFALYVPGLAEKRPSLILGDQVYVRPHGQTSVLFEAHITAIEGNCAQISGFAAEFKQYYSRHATFDIRFLTSRVPQECMLAAVSSVHSAQAACRVYPQRNDALPNIEPLPRYFNPMVEENPEQRSVVEHIVAGSSGTAPYLLFGPPGTGKTITVVEAILQLLQKPGNHILVCSDSNTAADNVADLLIKYLPGFPKEVALLRANSETRVWETMPQSLKPYSNGSNKADYYPLSIDDYIQHDVVITTLIHAAKFARELKKKKYDRMTTHLFIDEAAQASEPAALVPVCGLLAPRGQLVLAGDPKQLGPIVMSHYASGKGLGVSLMERLQKEFPMYQDMDRNYITMLKRNFRSHEDILNIPSQLFYDGHLKALARPDPISAKAILDPRKDSRAIEFYGLLSRERRMGQSPSYYNESEIEIVQSYVTALLTVHRIQPADIGIISPYIRQVYKIKEMLKQSKVEGIEVGTVESFQGREKSVVIVSTVRAACDLFANDAKFRLGFVANPKRFNVAVTRAKHKLIVVGNPLCLRKDQNWNLYMERCREIGTYNGFVVPADTDLNQSEVIAKISPILQEITKSVSKVTL